MPVYYLADWGIDLRTAQDYLGYKDPTSIPCGARELPGVGSRAGGGDGASDARHILKPVPAGGEEHAGGLPRF